MVWPGMYIRIHFVNAVANVLIQMIRVERKFFAAVNVPLPFVETVYRPLFVYVYAFASGFKPYTLEVVAPLDILLIIFTNFKSRLPSDRKLFLRN